ncbi:MAG: di-trans,poly-cis-decaprenylcistransferase, partial [Flavobacteriales bacterium]|nr:di-trans,poly-cis-decaprenylcistransferase [Flavobacteriales bacterium]
MSTEHTAEELQLRDRVDRERVPRHVAIIMDGNGRWAQQKGEMRVVGHINGVNAVREALVAATEIGVGYLTLYAFSTENWNRPREEVDALMDLLVSTMMDELEGLNKNGVRLNAIGDLDSLPGTCHDTLRQAMEATRTNDRITLTLALSYSSRWELTRMA